MKNNTLYKIFSNKKVLLYLNLFLILIIIVLIIVNNYKGDNSHKILRDQNNFYKLTSPILDCDSYEQGDNIAFSSSDFEKKFNSLKSKYNIEIASLYFRDLNNGPWIGINEREVFSPASLLKIPVIMALFKYAEKYPEILKEEVLVKESNISEDKNQNIIFEGSLEGGKKYTFLKVAESALKKSDNAAISIILDKISPIYISDVFYSIGVPYQDISNEVNLRVKDYAAFFRVLFNSSYLNRDMSEKMLEFLSESDYKNGLVRGVPKDIIVAHKFGERVIGDTRQLHDCGIVYYPKNPYLLCVMTRGGTFENEENFISDISNYVYLEFEKQKNNF